MEKVPQIPTTKPALGTQLLIKPINIREIRVFAKYNETIQGNPKHSFCYK